MGGDVAGVISRVRVENFMCHSNLTTELIDNVNFITGQNGSGKSAILTALCVAFGIKARGTQRATSLKDFIKTGCSYALVVVEMKNEGPDAFKPEIFGKLIIIERRITASSTTTLLKDQQGRKVASKKDDLQDLIDHFNIDVENPCVIMSQDKSREFLHSGNDKEKFKFFYKATLLQQVSDLLDANHKNIQACQAYLKANEETFRPYEQELAKLDEEIRRAEAVDEMAQEVTILRKRLAWSWVNDINHNIENAALELQKYQERVPKCQAKIDAQRAIMEEKLQAHAKTKAAVADLLSRTEQVKLSRDKLYQELAHVTTEKARLEEHLQSRLRTLNGKLQKKQLLESYAHDMQEKFAQNSQAEESVRDESIRMMHEEISIATDELRRIQENEEELNRRINTLSEEIETMSRGIEERRQKYRESQGYIKRLRNQQNNQVTAFGGDKVLRLMRTIESNRRSFTRPPLGPVGAHIALAGDGSWALAVEVAVGKLLNAFIVNNHKDMLTLRTLARECQYANLQIIIYDFDHPLLNLPQRLLPDQRLVTVISILQTESATVRNVLVDQGGVERQVLVKDYDEGKYVAFNRQRYANVKEVFTMDGLRMFSRGGSQTTLPRDMNIRGGRLGVGIDDRISQVENELLQLDEDMKSIDTRKRMAEDSFKEQKRHSDSAKRRKLEIQQVISRKELHLRDLKQQAQAAAVAATPNTEELEQEILDVEAEKHELEQSIEELRRKLGEVQVNYRDAKSRHDTLCDSAKDDVELLQRTDSELQTLEDEANAAAAAMDHFTRIMNDKVRADINREEEKLKQLQQEREESYKKASQICPEEEVQALGGAAGTPQQLSAQLSRLQERVRREERHVTPAEQLQQERLRVEKRIFKKKQLHLQLKEKIETMCNIYGKRRTKFERNSSYLRRQLKWQFNGHLKKKAFSGQVKIDYEAKTLKLEVQMPQDASNSAVKDTRALSGGERSFSTLCFALALHEMTEAPFRAMDEFDVFMDAISRKISLETVVDFAIEQGSQWIFITPHDISLVKNHPKVKKQQMSAPRP